jgi:serine O-acetyltransferase
MVKKFLRITGRRGLTDFPSKKEITSFTQNIAIALFPALEGGRSESIELKAVEKQLKGLLKPIQKKTSISQKELVDAFFYQLKGIRKMLEGDAQFIASNDPAASSVEEVIMAYPGFYAIVIYRVAHILAKLGVPIIPRIMTEHAHSFTGIDIHPMANIGSEFFIDHGTGIVIGETAVIGSRVKLYQGVTIGALSVSKKLSFTKRHPTIEDNVIIYAGSTILGGDTVIGHDSVIGGNVWLTESVPPGSMVYQVSKVEIKERKGFNILIS